jgi:acyl dehydratase
VPDASYPRAADPFDFDVERGKVREFARATGAAHPDHEHEGFVPPTFLAVASGWWGPSWEEPGSSPLADEGLDPGALLHLEESYSFQRPLRVGDRLTGHLELLEPEEKVGRRAGPMTIYTTRTTFRDAAGDPVAEAVQRVAHVRGQPESGV